MNADSLLDTNIWVYAVSSDPAEQNKKLRALRLIATPRTGLSVQVLQEFFVTVTTKIKQPLSATEAQAWVDRMSVLPRLPVTANVVHRAIQSADRYRISYWDAAILCAAKELGAATVFSEDLNHGQTYDGIRVTNPFLD